MDIDYKWIHFLSFSMSFSLIPGVNLLSPEGNSQTGTNLPLDLAPGSRVDSLSLGHRRWNLMSDSLLHQGQSCARSTDKDKGRCSGIDCDLAGKTKTMTVEQERKRCKLCSKEILGHISIQNLSPNDSPATSKYLMWWL